MNECVIKNKDDALNDLAVKISWDVGINMYKYLDTARGMTPKASSLDTRRLSDCLLGFLIPKGCQRDA